MWFSYDFGTSTVAVKSLLWLGISRDFQILAPVYSLFFIKKPTNWWQVIQPWYSTGSSWSGKSVLYYIPASMSPNWRLANSYGILPAAVQPGAHLLLNNLNIFEPKNRVLNYNNHIRCQTMAGQAFVCWIAIQYIWQYKKKNLIKKYCFYVRTSPLLSKFHAYSKNGLEN